MNDLSPNQVSRFEKFQNPDITAKGENRAKVALLKPTTLWFNTGTLCNIQCLNCYIESSPANDALVYITTAEMQEYLDQIETRNWPIKEIAFTGGEPFMNPDMIDMARAALARGYKVLFLTNAMRPMMRKHIQEGLCALRDDYADKLTLRISLDHFTRDAHDGERGKGSYDITLQGMDWLRDQGFVMHVAGRSIMDKNEQSQRDGYAALFADRGYDIDAANHAHTILFPEMDETLDVPEITTECWGILNKRPSDIMCASSRMVVKRKGAERPSLLACTLLPYSPEFELGHSLEDAEKPVALNHPHCAKFCVLGGASCSA